MSKTIFITGATDGIGLELAKALASLGHILVLHGRNPAKLDKALEQVSQINQAAEIEGFLADFSKPQEVASLASKLRQHHDHLDILINNAGIFRTENPVTETGHDVRFVVNTIAPALLTQLLLPLMPKEGRIINLSSAAQAPVDLGAMVGEASLEPLSAYAQSKLALTMWSNHMARLHNRGPAFISVNPGSLLATKMVREGFGTNGSDISTGVEILRRAALDADFSEASGCYFDNDARDFRPPHEDALDETKCAIVVRALHDLGKSLVPEQAQSLP